MPGNVTGVSNGGIRPYLPELKKPVENTATGNLPTSKLEAELARDGNSYKIEIIVDPNSHEETYQIFKKDASQRWNLFLKFNLSEVKSTQDKSLIDPDKLKEKMKGDKKSEVEYEIVYSLINMAGCNAVINNTRNKDKISEYIEVGDAYKRRALVGDKEQEDYLKAIEEFKKVLGISTSIDEIMLQAKRMGLKDVNNKNIFMAVVSLSEAYLALSKFNEAADLLELLPKGVDLSNKVSELALFGGRAAAVDLITRIYLARGAVLKEKKEFSSAVTVLEAARTFIDQALENVEKSLNTKNTVIKNKAELERSKRNLVGQLQEARVSLAEAYLGAGEFKKAVEAVKEIGDGQIVFISREKLKGKVKSIEEKEYVFRANSALADALKGWAMSRGNNPEVATKEYGNILADFDGAISILKKLSLEMIKAGVKGNDVRRLSTDVSLAEAHLSRGDFEINYSSQVSAAPPEAYYELAISLLSPESQASLDVDFQSLKTRVDAAKKLGTNGQARPVADADKKDLLHRAVFVISDAQKYLAKKKVLENGYSKAAALLTDMRAEMTVADGFDYFRAQAGLAECYLGKDEYQIATNTVFNKETLAAAVKFFSKENIKTRDQLDVMSRFYLAQAGALKGQSLSEAKEKRIIANQQAFAILADLSHKIETISAFLKRKPGSKTEFNIQVGLAEASQGADKFNQALFILTNFKGQNIMKKLEELATGQAGYQKAEYVDLWLRGALVQAYSLISGGSYGAGQKDSMGQAEKVLEAAIDRMETNFVDKKNKKKKPEASEKIPFPQKSKFHEALADLNMMREDYSGAIDNYSLALGMVTGQNTEGFDMRMSLYLRRARAFAERNRPAVINRSPRGTAAPDRRVEADRNRCRADYQAITDECFMRRRRAIKSSDLASLEIFDELAAREKLARGYLMEGKYKSALSAFLELESRVREISLSVKTSDEKTAGDTRKKIDPFTYQIHYDLANCYARIGGEDSKRSKHLQLAQAADSRPRWPVKEEAKVRQQQFSGGFAGGTGSSSSSAYAYDYSYFQDKTVFKFGVIYDDDGDGVDDHILRIDGTTTRITTNVNVDVATAEERNRVYNLPTVGTIGGHLIYRAVEIRDRIESKYSSHATSTTDSVELPDHIPFEIDDYPPPDDPGNPENPLPPDKNVKTRYVLERVENFAGLENKDGAILVGVFFDKEGKYAGYEINGVKKFDRGSLEAGLRQDRIEDSLKAKFGGTFRLTNSFAASAGFMWDRAAKQDNRGVYGGLSYSLGKFNGWEFTTFGGAGYYVDSKTGYVYAGINLSKDQNEFTGGFNMGLPTGEPGFDLSYRRQWNRQFSTTVGGGMNANGYPGVYAQAMYEAGRFGPIWDAADFTAGAYWSPDKIGPGVGFDMTKELSQCGPLQRQQILANLAFTPIVGPDGRLVYEVIQPRWQLGLGVDARTLATAYWTHKGANGLMLGIGSEDMLGYNHFSQNRLSDISYSVGALKWFKIQENPLVYDQNIKRTEFFVGPNLVWGFIPFPIGFRKNPNSGQGRWLLDDSHFGYRNYAKGGPVAIRQAVVRIFDDEEKKLFAVIQTQLDAMQAKNKLFVIENKIDMKDKEVIKGLREFLITFNDTQNSTAMRLFNLTDSVRITGGDKIEYKDGELLVGVKLLEKVGRGQIPAMKKLALEMVDVAGKAGVPDKKQPIRPENFLLTRLDLQPSFKKFMSHNGRLEMTVNQEDNLSGLIAGLKALGEKIDSRDFSLEGLRKIVVEAESSPHGQVHSQNGVLYVKKSLVLELGDETKIIAAAQKIEEEFTRFDLRNGYQEFPDFKDSFGDRIVYDIHHRQNVGEYQLIRTNLNRRRVEVGKGQVNLKFALTDITKGEKQLLISRTDFQTDGKTVKPWILEKQMIADSGIGITDVDGVWNKLIENGYIKLVDVSEKIETVEYITREKASHLEKLIAASHGRIRYDAASQALVFSGRMTEEEKRTLVSYVKNPEDIKVIENIFQRSQRAVVTKKFTDLRKPEELELSEYKGKLEDIYYLLRGEVKIDIQVLTLDKKMLADYVAGTSEKISKNKLLENFIDSHNKKFSYDEASQSLLILGQMTEEEKNGLLSCFEKKEDKETITKLFQQTQITYVDDIWNELISKGYIEMIDDKTAIVTKKFTDLKQPEQLDLPDFKKKTPDFRGKLAVIFTALSLANGYIFNNEQPEKKIEKLARLGGASGRNVSQAEDLAYREMISEFMREKDSESKVATQPSKPAPASRQNPEVPAPVIPAPLPATAPVQRPVQTFITEPSPGQPRPRVVNVLPADPASPEASTPVAQKQPVKQVPVVPKAKPDSKPQKKRFLSGEIVKAGERSMRR